MSTMKTGLFFCSVLLAGIAFLPAGCSDGGDPVSGTGYDAASQVVDLDDVYGGFLAVDEEPAFGDPELLAQAAGEAPQEDGYAGLRIRQRDRVRLLECDPGTVSYALTILWGNPCDGPDSLVAVLDQDPVAWQGSLELSAGAIRLSSLIRFEPPEDQILPRTAAETLEWESVTHGFVDGIRVLVQLSADSTGEAAPQQLRLQLNDYVREMSTDELVDLDEWVDLDASAILLRAFRVDGSALARGFCNGFWTLAPGDSVGLFRGAWLRESGRLAGFLSGRYGVDAQGRQVFFGKYIDPRGRFAGFLRGRWDEEPAEADAAEPFAYAAGHFDGEWVNRSGHAVGEVGGHWRRGPEGRGVFNGAWHGQVIVPEP